MKTNRDLYPCGQCPRFADEDVDIVQSNTIVRHLARKHDLYGSSLADKAHVDAIIDTVESIKGKYLALIYQDELSDAAKAKYWHAHCDPTTTCERNGGAHFVYIAGMMEKFGKSGFMVGTGLTVADIMVFDIVDMHVRIWGTQFTDQFPQLNELHAKVAAVPGVAAYLSSGRRIEKQNGNGLG